MLDTRTESPLREAPVVRTRDPGVTDLLLDVLESVRSYDAHILLAERDGDRELAGFLRELRGQDLARSTQVVRLLRRPIEETDAPRTRCGVRERQDGRPRPTPACGPSPG